MKCSQAIRCQIVVIRRKHRFGHWTLCALCVAERFQLFGLRSFFHHYNYTANGLSYRSPVLKFLSHDRQQSADKRRLSKPWLKRYGRDRTGNCL